MDQKPLLGITMGDPAGIGPEIVVKALAKAELYQQVRPLVIGDGGALERALRVIFPSPVVPGSGVGLSLHSVSRPAEGYFRPGLIDYIDLENVPAKLALGQINAAAGRAAFDYIQKAIDLALSGEIDGVVTAPINKQAIRAAGIDFIGHTEMFADLTKSRPVLTMFQVQNLRIFHLTRHVSLIEACRQMKRDYVLETLFSCQDTLQRLGFRRPRLAVAALNPHGGEGGLFGDEELKEIAPAVEDAKTNGLSVSGPIAADSVFYLANQGHYDAVLALYHDQGHIAAKMLDFERTVSVTTGLPFIRTSVDHGTAFDIAGRGVASSTSLEEAIRVAGFYAAMLKK